MKKQDDLELEILKALQEEWENKNSVLFEKSKKKKKVKKPENVRLEPRVINPLASGLRIKHKDSKGVDGYEYTIIDVVGNDVILMTPEGEEMKVPKMRLGREYVLD